MKKVAKALNYNEQKVTAAQADLLFASNFLKDAKQLTFHDKLEHFRRLQTLNERVVTNTLHVSLNFDPSEQLEEEKLRTIAATYMQGIGFGKQPYLVYRHEDAGHPHIHIVSTNIQTDGSRISMHNLGRNQSETTRKEIEQRFGLIRANSSEEALPLQRVSVTKVQYGKGTLRQAVSNVLRTVLNQYNYTSLEQLNAILKAYNVVADKGGVDSRIARYHGLQYHVLNEGGEKAGVPIKASSLHSRPTLSFLEKRFTENASGRPKLARHTRQALDWILQRQYASLDALQVAAEKEGIQMVIRWGKENIIYGITYVDVKSKLVINGSELGKKYSAKGIGEQLNDEAGMASLKKISLTAPEPVEMKPNPPAKPSAADQSNDSPGSLLETLLSPEPERDEVTYPFGKRKRKKKRMKL